MKITSFVVSGAALSLFLFGLYLYIFPAETEYQQAPAQAYIEGATAPHFDIWEM